MLNRVNPTLVRVPLEWATKVDTQGHRVGDDQMFWDSLRQVIPIPAQALSPKQQVTQSSAMDDFLKGMGVEAHKIFSPAETLAMQKASGRSFYEPLEGDALAKAQQRYKLEEELRDALQAGDRDRWFAAQQAILKASRGSDAVFSPKQAADSIVTNLTYRTRLTATVHHLGLEDALAVYNAASPIERRTLRNLINQKTVSWYKGAAQGRKTAEEMATMHSKLQSFRADRP